ncbi:hypothetical protein Tco_0446282 [Tanacetum coccineum]
MKTRICQVRHNAYYAKESPIPPPTIVPSSLMLSPMFNPQDFFLPKELLPFKKRGRDRSPSSTFCPTFNICDRRKLLRVRRSLEHHEKQIEEIYESSNETPL